MDIQVAGITTICTPFPELCNTRHSFYQFVSHKLLISKAKRNGMLIEFNYAELSVNGTTTEVKTEILVPMNR